MRVVLDTNFLVDCVRFKVDISSELVGNELFVLDSVLFELEKIAGRGSKESAFAKMALDYVKGKGLKILKSKEKSTDKSLQSYSEQGYAIATHDRVLKNRIKNNGGKVIYIRQKRYVVFE